ncbi:VanZ like protein [Scopulibacillus darangshiensis]|uniref:VanZ like protein n=1 Tax=Scopulibacillus darangshiensis TaxID=442528 RepID=A0A4R2NSZ4_9BACL|nr:VanZ family protein [Scopulibacillus darangshiensis]TCP24525.1 VanZ like protein [Scopulibacillus darangshiensis]
MPEVVRKRVKRFCTGMFVTYLTILIYVTLFTYNYYVYGRSFNLVFFDSIKLMLNSGNPWLFIKNVLGNVILFMPFGFLLPLVYRKLRTFTTCLVLSFIMSLSIEISQYVFAKRIFDIDDIFLNTFGAILGWIVFKLLYILMNLIFNSHKKTSG